MFKRCFSLAEMVTYIVLFKLKDFSSESEREEILEKVVIDNDC